MFLAGHGVPLQADIAVGDMMKKDQERYPERREELLNMLGVDPNWRMHQASKTHEACVIVHVDTFLCCISVFYVVYGVAF